MSKFLPILTLILFLSTALSKDVADLTIKWTHPSVACTLCGNEITYTCSSSPSEYFNRPFYDPLPPQHKLVGVSIEINPASLFVCKKVNPLPTSYRVVLNGKTLISGLTSSIVSCACDNDICPSSGIKTASSQDIIFDYNYNDVNTIHVEFDDADMMCLNSLNLKLYYDVCDDSCQVITSKIEVIESSSSNMLMIGLISVGFGATLLIIIIGALCLRKKKPAPTPTKGDEDYYKNNNIGPMSNLRVLGEGNFGSVYKADWNRTPVALKKLKDNNSKLLKEADMMKSLLHPFIVTYYGIYRADNGDQYIVSEFAQLGDLYNFTRKVELTDRDLLYITRDIASGMCYLHLNNVVHGDLALRNLLVDEESMDDARYRVRVTDFGMAKTLNPDSLVYRASKEESMLPTRWCAPECLESKGREFSKQTDVWSFGITIWELYSKEDPYPGKRNAEVLSYLKAGNRLPKPERCPDDIYAVLLKCWEMDPLKRPSMESICALITSLIHRDETPSSQELSALGSLPPSPRYSVTPETNYESDGSCITAN